MHMADALLSPAVGLSLCAVSAGAIAYSATKLNQEELSDKKVPLMAVSGAFVFAAQMINFTIPGTGSSGHIGGGILLAAMLGPFPAFLTIAAVLIIQCLFFADGGLLALGANLFNMGLIPCLIVYPLLFKPFLRKGMTALRFTVASVLSVIIGMQLGAFGVVLETLLSGVTSLPFGKFVLLMQPIHLAIGVVEGIVTAAILGFVLKMRPEILESALAGRGIKRSISIKKVLISVAILTVIVGSGLSLYASANPDGLEWSIEKVTGSTEISTAGTVYDTSETIQERTAFMPDYGFPGADESSASSGTSVAGFVGSILTFIIAGGVGLLISRSRKAKAKSEV